MSWPEVWSSRITKEQLLQVPSLCGSSHLITAMSMYIVSQQCPGKSYTYIVNESIDRLGNSACHRKNVPH